MDFEQSKFTGGLCLRPTPDELRAHQCQEAEDCEFSREVGAVGPRRGVDKYYDRSLGADEVFWQNILDTAGPIIRAGDRLYDGLRPVACGLTDAEMRFEEYGDHVIGVNGYENLKYKQSGMNLTVHTAYMFDFEYDAIVDAGLNLGACVQSFLHAYGDPLGEGDAEWRCTFEWERNYIEGDTLDEDSDDFYTHTTCKNKTIAGTELDQMDVCRAVNLGIPEGGQVSLSLEGSPTHDAYVKLLIHCDGDAGATDFSDSAQNHTLTANGDAQKDTAQKKFGTASALFDGDGDYISAAQHNDFNVADNRFGIDLWARFNSLSSIEWNYMDLFSCGLINDSGTNGFMSIYLRDYGSGSYKLYFSIFSEGSRYDMYTSWTPTIGTWYHIYVCRGWNGHANDWALCVDGDAVDTKHWVITATAFASGVYIGCSYDSDEESAGGYFNGWLDEIRFINGAAPWHSNFTVPTAAYSLSLTGTFRYKVTYANYDGREGNGGGVSTVSPSGQTVSVTLPISDDPQVVARKLYRTEDAGNTYKFAALISNNYESSYEDTLPDADLGDTLLTTQYEPPIFSEVHDRQSLLWGVEAANKNKIWWSNSYDDWDAFEATNFETFGSSTEESVALESLAEFLIVIQQVRVWKFNTEEDPEVLSESFSAVGAPCGRATWNLKDAILIVDAAGIYLFDAVKSLKFSQKIDPIFDGGGSYAERINLSYLTNLRVGNLDNRIYVSYTRTGQTVNDRTLVYDRELEAFQGVMQKGFTSFAADKKGKVILATGTDGYVYQLETGNDDDGSAIAWNFRTKDFSEELIQGSLSVSSGELKQKSGDRIIWKRAGKIRFDLDPLGDAMTIQMYYDDSLIKTLTYTDESRAIKEARLNPDTDFTRLSIKVSGSTTKAQRFYGFRLMGTQIIGEGQ